MRLSLVKLGVKAVPKAKAPAMGFDKGFNKFYNFYTVQGRLVVFAAASLVLVGIVKLSIWKYERPFKAEARKEAEAKRELFERQVRAWEANGKKFD